MIVVDTSALLALVDADGQEIGAIVDAERDLLAQETVEQVGELGERILEVDDRRAQGLLAREGEKLAHQARRAVGVLVDLHQIGIIRVRVVMSKKEKVAMP